jgi:hypothetical protein
MRMFNSRLTRKTLAYSKELVMYCASAAWEDINYNLARPLKTLRLEILNDPRRRWKHRTPATLAPHCKCRCGCWSDEPYLDC